VLPEPLFSAACKRARISASDAIVVSPNKVAYVYAYLKI
jgi:hypothetical protein